MTVVIYYHRCDLLSVAFLVWLGPLGLEPVDPVVADPVRQDNDKKNNIQIYGNSLLKYTEGGDKTSQCSYPVVILSNWVPDNWVYRLSALFPWENKHFRALYVAFSGLRTEIYCLYRIHSPNYFSTEGPLRAPSYM